MFKYGIAVAAAAMLAAGGAHAAVETFNLDLNACSTSCFNSGVTSVGVVTVTEEAGGKLMFNVSLGSPNSAAPLSAVEKVLFNANPNGQHHSFAFNLDVTGATISSVSDISTKTGFQIDTGGPFSQSGFGDFGYALSYNGSNKQGHTDSSLSFVVSDAGKVGGLTLADLVVNSNAIYMAADVYGEVNSDKGNTGNVGAELGTVSTGTPEPATWAMLILGVAGVGAAMRRRAALSLA